MSIPPAAAVESQHRVPWYVWCSVAAATCADVGFHWDISWHRSIGRDTFWTPAHMVIYMCGILAGISSGYLVLSTTFSRRSLLRDCSVFMWGFRGPLGAFIAAWGGIAMLTSGPFDNWWHNTYGLDAKINSPPHMVLTVGILAVHVGALILIQGQMNRTSGPLRERLHRMLLYLGGITLVWMSIMQMEIADIFHMHTAHFYYLVALVAPPVLAGLARASRYRWAASTVAAVYFGFLFLIGHLLPLFPAEPKLGPVFHKITHLVPPEFPLLLVFPAFALDLIWRSTSRWHTARQALASGIVFLGVFVAVQWPFANFLISQMTKDGFFAQPYNAFYIVNSAYTPGFGFAHLENGLEFWRQAALALFTAICTSWLGLVWGNWMQRIRR